ncbi:YolD-like family protein [Cohnella sp.]|uniref:YolD-like family protein n=1 Tax=Cohnella sp. TaxID=1883426 RepID=UPI0035689FCF
MKNDQGNAKSIEVSLIDQRFIVLRYLDSMQDRELTGIVTKIDQQSRRIELSHTEGADWIHLDDILHITVLSD